MHNYIFKFVVLILLTVLCVNTTPTVSNTATTLIESVVATEPTTDVTEPTYEIADIPPMIDLPEINSFKTIYDVEDAITKCDAAIDEYDQILMNLPDSHPQYSELIASMTTLMQARDEYQKVLDAHWESRMDRRPHMTHIWRALKAYGWSDAVVAGVIGNMSAETGGMGYQDIEWDIYARDPNGNLYYGVCMWAVRYASKSLPGASLDGQIEYLYSNIERQMNTVYSKSLRNKYGILNLRYEDFLEIDNPYDAAIAFAVCYERPGSEHIDRRGTQAEKAYDYFINLNTWPWAEPF